MIKTNTSRNNYNGKKRYLQDEMSMLPNKKKRKLTNDLHNKSNTNLKTNEKFNKFIEEAAKSVEQINFVEMVKRQKNLTKMGTAEGYSLYDL